MALCGSNTLFSTIGTFLCLPLFFSNARWGILLYLLLFYSSMPFLYITWCGDSTLIFSLPGHVYLMTFFILVLSFFLCNLYIHSSCCSYLISFICWAFATKWPHKHSSLPLSFSLFPLFQFVLHISHSTHKHFYIRLTTTCKTFTLSLSHCLFHSPILLLSHFFAPNLYYPLTHSLY